MKSVTIFIRHDNVCKLLKKMKKSINLYPYTIFFQIVYIHFVSKRCDNCISWKIFFFCCWYFWYFFFGLPQPSPVGNHQSCPDLNGFGGNRSLRQTKSLMTMPLQLCCEVKNREREGNKEEPTHIKLLYPPVLLSLGWFLSVSWLSALSLWVISLPCLSSFNSVSNFARNFFSINSLFSLAA